MENREYSRKCLDPIHITDMQVIDRFMTLACYGTVLNASATGHSLRSNATISARNSNATS